MHKVWVLVAVLSLLGGTTLAGYPEKPVEMGAWASPGGGSDLMWRTFTKALEEVGFPQPLYVVNKPAAPAQWE